MTRIVFTIGGYIATSAQALVNGQTLYGTSVNVLLC
jgi:hypothetical protein